MEFTEEEYLAHYGILRKSGRYPWGSGEEQKKRFPWGAGDTQNKRNKMFLDIVEQHRKVDGMTDLEIAKAYGMSLADLRKLKTIARNEQTQNLLNQIQRMQDKGMSNVAIAERLGLSGESRVRALTAAGVKDKAAVLTATTDMLRRQVEEKGAIDVGTDVYRSISLNDNPSARVGISSTKFDTAVAALREEGYKLHYVPVPQLGTGNNTTTMVLAKPDVKWKDLVDDPQRIKPITEHTPDGGRSYEGFKPPLEVAGKRIRVIYGDEGGREADGLIYVRPGVKDLSMGGSRYAQVRIAVDGTHYLKGMAVYNEDMPPGIDLVFHTNKSYTGDKHDAMKAKSDDPDMPFSAVVSQLKDEHHNVISAINKVNEEGDWDTWSKNLPSQFLSKQSPKLAKGQLDKTYENRRKEFDEITALTNPTVRKKLLETFADETDSAAVDLKAYHMPSQATKVLIPIKSIKENEVFCPSLTDGTRVSLVRFPHGGTFEIPEVTVNNKNREARRILGTSNPDAMGIHHKVAERLSGADFDGDYVLALPNMRGDIKSTPALEGLKGFDPKSAYKAYDGMRTVNGGTWNEKTKKVEFAPGKRSNPSHMQHLMGDVSNLVTDMTIKGASPEELARAVRHSMVVIDCEKHVLDYKSSARDNAIHALKLKYQPRVDKHGRTVAGGASTIISRAKADKRVDVRKARAAAEGGPIDKATGQKVYTPTGETYVDKKTGKTVRKTTVVKQLSDTQDAHTLVSQPDGTPIERIYADHSNRLKALANEARKEYLSTPSIRMSESSKKIYSTEVASLNSKLNVARMNAPRERQAQAVANSMVAQKKAANPDLESADLKKIRNQALAEARVRTGAHKDPVVITDREWQAIQAGAISNNMLKMILDNGNIDEIRKLATPHTKVLMTPSYVARAKTMLDRGATQADVAAQLGVSLSTLKASLESSA